ncbi:hypothetical protein B0675_36455 [Streptomyces sp. M41(2017)]|uniref:hypothetical protein n=1 Tax=Streptomyces sp. M41(2017) TaxID=1955065 RepID=UPI0009BE97D4|nr:hypothetical protein [Streptomyces sp. M41(2017)]OQQ12938.1 hypothetical protein B0675_39625 [Streptomyces sp. M41(2017)]OQQ15493.1 hypothetical protein B0675_36455 [Streptomyces sp. M41(2017)]
MNCRKHGPGCSVRWGYDQEHTDSGRPYTAGELGERVEAPHRHAYSSAQEYELGFRTWRAMRRDDRLTAAEEQVREPLILGRLGIAGSSFDEVIERALKAAE